MVRVAIVGGGNIARLHAACYDLMPDVKIVGFAEPLEAARQALAQRGARPTFERIEALLDATTPDLVDVCTPTPAHRPMVETALRSGARHVLCEKPLARTVADARAMVELADARAATLYVGHVVRFWREFATIRRAVAAGEIGRPISARSIRAAGHPPAPWFADFAQSGGVILDMIVHDFDFHRWCFGPVERVYARSATGRAPGRADFALAILRFASGTLVHVEGNWARGGGHTAIEVVGTAGSMRCHLQANAPLTVDPLEGESIPDAWSSLPRIAGTDSPFFDELRHVVDCVATGATPLVGGLDGLRAVAIAEAALESARTGESARPAVP